jgi:hypothetical protein
MPAEVSQRPVPELREEFRRRIAHGRKRGDSPTLSSPLPIFGAGRCRNP